VNAELCFVNLLIWKAGNERVNISLVIL